MLIKKTKAQIKALLKKGSIKVGFCPCKLSPDGFWFTVTLVEVKDIEQLEKYIASFSYYNCNNEVGNYLHYYIEG